MPILASITAPDFMMDFAGFGGIDSWFTVFTATFVAVLISAAVIWTSALAWRKFKETTNKV